LYAAAQIAYHNNEIAKLKEVAAMIEPLNIETGEYLGTAEAKLWEKENIIYNQATIDILEGKYDSAKEKAEEIKKTLDPIKDPTKLSDYDFLLGEISMKQKSYADAVSHFEKTNPTIIYNKYCLAMANEMNGNKNKANGLYKEVAEYNFNDIGYALVRNDAKKKSAGQ
jgi:TolA-binding protein